MNPSGNSPLVKHLVLIGGGHSHLSVLKYLGMHPVPGLVVTLISRDINTPYSGSLPGYLTRLYTLEDIHIDLRPLAQFAGVRIIQGTVDHIDLEQKIISCDGRPNIEFDLLSINIGSQPDAIKIPGAAEHAIGIKPIDQFIQKWQSLLENAVSRLSTQTADYDLIIVGGGPASVELAFSTQHRIHQELGIKHYKNSNLNIKIISADNGLLGSHNAKVQKFVMQELEKREIEVLLNHKVEEFQAGKVLCEGGISYTADSMVFATGASIAPWPAKCGLAIGSDGFIEVNSFLQSTSHDFVFVAGDAASIKGEPRPKSGVYAVRHGKPLAENLIRYATSKKLKRHTPQKHALALISMANKTAIASRNKLFFQGRSMWSLKHSIDTGFIKKYSELPPMSAPLDIAKGLVDTDTELELKKHAMRCAGCGAKVASNILEEVLQQLPEQHNEDILWAGSKIEDAALIKIDDDKVLLQSIDQLRAFVNDPWLFAKIATNHCLSDIYAMGCSPHSALAVVSLPTASKKLTKSMLQEVMLGCSEVLQENGCSLIGGHSAESTELQFGLCVNGFAKKEALLSKSGMQNGDIIILCKPLGTGTLLAADMRYKAKHVWIDNAFNQMLVSNKHAAECFIRHKATACTDITGFGLAGHLFEMLNPNNVELELNLSDLPALEGALETLQQEIFSSLHQDNSQVQKDIFNAEAFQNNPRFELLFDPQTSGGLLASVPESQAENCIRELQESGYEHAQCIGQVSNIAASQAALILK